MSGDDLEPPDPATPMSPWPAVDDAALASDAGDKLSPPARPRTRRWLPIALAALVLVLAALAGWALYAMRANDQRAESWQRRAVALEANTKQLESLVGARTRLLNQRIDQMNALAGKLKRSQVALNQSQGDVSSLEERQRELANEKAQLQDQQRALDGVAAGYLTCKRDLIQLLSDEVSGYDTTYDYATANSDCSSADSALQSYLSAYPNG